MSTQDAPDRSAIYAETFKRISWAAESMAVQYGGECKFTLHCLGEYLEENKLCFPTELYASLYEDCVGAREALCFSSDGGAAERCQKAGFYIRSMFGAMRPVMEKEQEIRDQRVAKLELALVVFKEALEELEDQESGSCEQCAEVLQLGKGIRGEIDRLFGDGTVATADAENAIRLLIDGR